jgi:hypothetical protein
MPQSKTKQTHNGTKPQITNKNTYKQKHKATEVNQHSPQRKHPDQPLLHEPKYKIYNNPQTCTVNKKLHIQYINLKLAYLI